MESHSDEPLLRRSAMNRALSIPEIVRKIFSSFSIPADRHELVSLSTTNRIFQEYALDALWSHVRGVAVFCRILFPNAGTKYSKDRLISIARNSWSSRTERFQAFCSERERQIAEGFDERRRQRVYAYTSRVKKITMGTTDMDDPETYSFFAFIAAYPPSPPHSHREEPSFTSPPSSVFPNLRHLSCTVVNVHAITHVVHLLQLTSQAWGGSPFEPGWSSLTSLDISANVTWTYQPAAQATVNDRFIELAKTFEIMGGLQNLSFHCDQLGSTIELAFAKALKHLRSLKSVRLGMKKHAIGWAVVALDGNADKIREMQLDFSREDVPVGLMPHPSGLFQELISHTWSDEELLTPVQRFSQVRKLQLSASLPTLLDTLQYFNFPPPNLEEVTLHISTPTDEQLSIISESISSNASQLRLCRISDVRSWANKRTFTGAASFYTMRSLYPLLALALLETLIIDLDAAFTLTDDDLALMGSCWAPSLKQLHLSPWKQAAAEMPSFRGLKSLTDACRELTTLMLRINASKDVTKFVEDVQRLKRPTSGLREWQIGLSYIEQGECEVVAEAIYAIFPDLHVLGLPKEISTSPDYHEEWVRALEIYKRYQGQAMDE